MSKTKKSNQRNEYEKGDEQKARVRFEKNEDMNVWKIKPLKLTYNMRAEKRKWVKIEGICLKNMNKSKNEQVWVRWVKTSFA